MGYKETRYCRNILIPEIGEAGQERLLKSRVLVVGAGGLGSPALYYLACAGIGTIGIIDADRVDLSNLQRQILHTTESIGRLKVESAMESLRRINPDIRVEGYPAAFTHANGHSLVRSHDFVIEATDNFESKFLINDTCLSEGVPFCHAGLVGMYGQVMTVVPGKGPCFRCVFRDIPHSGEVPATSEAGVLGAVAGVLGSIQATEAVKFLAGCGDLLIGRLITFDALKMRFREVPLPESSCEKCREAGLTGT